ncbi:MAG TPA: mannonate dehydratase [Candidatus Acidoferrum sp.]|nr:mannonate dehydratase [Candidatus Acidoferrum sp.]
MKETWRWFGPPDPIQLDQIKQAGATGIVSALHHIYRGEAWPLDEVLKRKAEIEAAGLVWSVVESIPVHNSIKLRSGPYLQYIAAWRDSLAAIAKAGVPVVCYNFMPLVDWTRTDLKWRLPSTGYALRFDAVDFAAYDLFILERPGAELDYPPELVAAARARFHSMSEAQQEEIERAILVGLPGAESSYNRKLFREARAEWKGVTPGDLRSSLLAFLQEVVPVAEELDVRLAIHPDDPPWPLFGLPRVVSTAGDARSILAGVDSLANGLTFCVGSYGARADNNLLAMVGEFAPRIHFAHLRQVVREADGSFHEAEHLNGSSDMVGVIRALLTEESHRRRASREDHEIPMRPDHGHLLADDINKKTNPGYSYVGRLKGLAELRGVVEGLKYTTPEFAD